MARPSDDEAAIRAVLGRMLLLGRTKSPMSVKIISGGEQGRMLSQADAAAADYW